MRKSIFPGRFKNFNFSGRTKKIAFFALSLIFLRIFLFVLPFPELTEFEKRPCSTRIRDRNGALLQVLPLEGGLRREFSPIDRIPKNVQDAFIQAEDRRFWWHFGVDPISALRAAVQNVAGKRRVSGASTITMQLSRMVCPSSGRGFGAKVKDCLNAVRIEGKLSKRRILELYLNSVPFGSNVEGVASAARTFCSKELHGLTDEEVRSLSLIPRNPSRYNLFPQSSRFSYPFEFPHYIRRLFSQGLISGADVSLPVDIRIQKTAEERLSKAISFASGARISNCAGVVFDTRTGDVLSWVGSQDFSDSDGMGQIDGVSAKVQAGSSMKPFLYALALDSGWKPNDVLRDVPTEFGGGEVYIPQNFNNRFNGPVRMRAALASSLNIPAVSLLDSIGVEKYAKTLEKLGFDSLRGRTEEVGLGLALGAGEITLAELANAFRVFASDGILDGQQVYSKNSARILCSMLSDKAARSMAFGRVQTFETAYPAIFKTGTSNQYQSIVAVGSTKEYTVGVWMGNFSGSTVIGKTGSSLPALAAREILDFLEEGANQKNLEFPLPEGFSMRSICPVSGKKPGPFCRTSVLELIPDGESLEECAWHREGGLFLPDEYQRWISGGWASIDWGGGALEIVSPKDGGVFYFDQSKSLIPQFVRLEASGGFSDEAELILDGETFSVISRPFVAEIPARRGEHTLTVDCAGERKSVSFSVR